MAFSRAYGPAPHRTIIDLLAEIPAVDAQNRLMRIGDKEIAMSLLFMADGEQDRIVNLLGRGKGTRVRDELTRQRHSRIADTTYETAVRTVIRALQGGRTEAPRTYYRPTRSRTR
ncbi:MAG: hypothetical protein PF508_05010 [Spirochaeta sp.]|jgi:hypothetical protein|nr:hypothetical protein [Spirochaeta sp.]